MNVLGALESPNDITPFKEALISLKCYFPFISRSDLYLVVPTF